MKIKKALLVATACLCAFSPAYAQVLSDQQPIVFSQTYIAIVPGSVVPKTPAQSPELQGTMDSIANSGESKEAQSETAEAEAIADAKNALEQQPLIPKITVRVQVRPDQIPLDKGIFHNYKLDVEHGVLTYFSDAFPRDIVAENIQKPLDILFVDNEGIVRQIMPEVVLAYLAEDVRIAFPLRALLYLEAGLSGKLGIQPGFRIEHGMFRPKPLVYTTPNGQE
jgi:uncharacterized membrane protein (UPF0127 family)